MKIIATRMTLVFLAAALSHTAHVAAQQPPLAELDRYNVVWTTPGANAAGSMPIGNGEVGLNVWIEEGGDLLFYVARTDAWSECNRLLKLGRVRLSFSQAILGKDRRFRQELVLRDGRIEIRTDDAEIGLFVDSAAPVVYVVGRCKTPTTVTARLENWRTEKRVLKGEELRSSWTMQDAPDSIEVWESPDVVDSSAAGAIAWHHRNRYSVVPLTLKHQGLDSLAGAVRDPLIGRTFGGIMRGQGFAVTGPGALETERPLERFALAIATHAAQTDSADQWKRETAALADAADAQKALERTARWWYDFWNRSWIFVSGGDEAETARVTQSYILQRWIAACGGRGNYPIKFNGSIFTVDPKYSGGPDFNPDWRRWGDCFWWQNTRLPYFAMIASGDFDGLASVFRFYRDVLPVCRARAKLYYDAEGAYFPETMTIFGTYANRDYGWDRTGRQPNEVACKYWRYSWQQGLELAALMLDYYEYTENDRFLREELIPMARDVLRYYESRFCRDGKMTITPTQSIETYWFDVVNDTPSVAGLRDVLGRLLAIPAERTPPAEREYWTKLLAATPPLPLVEEKGVVRVLPAEKFNPKRDNCENPELYAIWPFQLYGVGRPNLPVGVETFHRRIEKASIGWQYDGQCAAIVGLVDEAKRILLKKVGNSNPKHRFPAMWGPNYDWLPDQDHGSNILLTLQHMALASAGGQVYLLPAWPKDWNVSFKLRAPRNTVVECVYRNGRIEKLDVSPESRRKDVQPSFGEWPPPRSR